MSTWVEELYSNQINPTEVYTGLANAPISFFVMNDKCYILDGTNFLVYDGATVAKVEDTPYVPTLTISRPPAGGGEPYEDFNLLGTAFKESFSGDGSATKYVLSLRDIDATAVIAMVNSTTMNEGSGFTVDRAKGEITFTTAPSSGTNNVIITAHKTHSSFKNRIRKCTFNVIFGGSNDTRVFISGNPDYKNHIYRSGLNDPSYWPENGVYKPGSDTEAVQGFSKQYDYLIIEKEYSKWNMGFELNDGVPSFPMKPINDQVGTVARKSIQSIENNPVSLNKRGVYTVTASNVRDERNVKHLSTNIDPFLLKEPNLDKAISVDFDKRYWIAVNNKVYVYDYQIEEWYIYDNIPANCFLSTEDSLYFGHTTTGMIYCFKKQEGELPYNDDGQAIHAYWKSKLMNLGFPERKKLIRNIFFTLKPSVHTSAEVLIRTDVKGERIMNESRMDRIDFFDFDFSRFTFLTSDMPQEVAVKAKEKKISHFQLKIVNNVVDESLGIDSLGIKYSIQNEVK